MAPDAEPGRHEQQNEELKDVISKLSHKEWAEYSG